jgi:hypothetical protein
MSFPEATRPTVIYLAVLLGTVSSHAADYTIYEHQCYWFASAIWDALQTLFGGTVSYESSDLRPSMYRGLILARNKFNPVIMDAYRARFSMAECQLARVQREREQLAEQVFIQSVSLQSTNSTGTA